MGSRDGEAGGFRGCARRLRSRLPSSAKLDSSTRSAAILGGGPGRYRKFYAVFRITTIGAYEDYYNKLSVPHKELIWLEGGHGLGSADPSQFLDVMVNRVRNQST